MDCQNHFPEVEMSKVRGHSFKVRVAKFKGNAQVKCFY